MKSFSDEQQSASKALFQWLADNQMKANSGKCHFTCSSNLKKSIMVENRQIHNSTCEKLLDVFFDSKLTFKSHIDNICKKIYELWIDPYMNFNKRKLVVNSFFSSQLPVNCCPLIWMCHNRTHNNKINSYMKDSFAWSITIKTHLSKSLW